ncbi:DNA adenine methylase [Nocardioides marmoribigeumensis]|uniref:site-specific DNA-methyltransferase (adenine-specific) n=1 Tax=Nocardioides marmoribigeumensis TaxID=433649 RepID=A0ABU2BZN7_9ACTN|nr:DNA adenine methylase [Nocardioides marmoribigeumensis]MDR7363834.1 adenine-specific DNA-methyltransferase [Nocardioides marmoribigeumensis]
MIKYLGSKRTLVPVLGEIAAAVGARTALDLFTGTTRVAQEFKRRGVEVTANDRAAYSAVLSDCFVATDAATVDLDALDEALAHLDALPGRPGYVTETFCHASRYFQPHNGARIDAVRHALETDFADHPLRAVLMTSLLVAADRVDSTTGVQMAYLKSWSPRSYRDLRLVRPDLLPGPGTTLRGEAADAVDLVGPVDLAYLDPPYNQHRYETNYHVWETLVRGDEPDHYGVACKRVDSRDLERKSVFNIKRAMPAALADLVARVRAEVVVVSCNDESWVSPHDLQGWLQDAGHERVALLGFDARRYVGAQIGVFNAAGERVGQARRLRNVEHLLVAGPSARVEAAVAAVEGGVFPAHVPALTGEPACRDQVPAT